MEELIEYLKWHKWHTLTPEFRAEIIQVLMDVFGEETE